MPARKGQRINPLGKPKGGGSFVIPDSQKKDASAILGENALIILQKAIDMAIGKGGEKPNATIMTKLLDKILPTIIHNKNEQVKGFEDWVLERHKEKMRLFTDNQQNKAI